MAGGRIDVSGITNALGQLQQSNALVAARREREKLRREASRGNQLRTMGALAGTLIGASAGPTGAAIGGTLGGMAGNAVSSRSGGNTTDQSGVAVQLGTQLATLQAGAEAKDTAATNAWSSAAASIGTTLGAAGTTTTQAPSTTEIVAGHGKQATVNNLTPEEQNTFTDNFELSTQRGETDQAATRMALDNVQRGRDTVTTTPAPTPSFNYSGEALGTKEGRIKFVNQLRAGVKSGNISPDQSDLVMADLNYAKSVAGAVGKNADKRIERAALQRNNSQDAVRMRGIRKSLAKKNPSENDLRTAAFLSSQLHDQSKADRLFALQKQEHADKLAALRVQSQENIAANKLVAQRSAAYIKQRHADKRSALRAQSQENIAANKLAAQQAAANLKQSRAQANRFGNQSLVGKSDALIGDLESKGLLIDLSKGDLLAKRGKGQLLLPKLDGMITQAAALDTAGTLKKASGIVSASVWGKMLDSGFEADFSPIAEKITASNLTGTEKVEVTKYYRDVFDLRNTVMRQQIGSQQTAAEMKNVLKTLADPSQSPITQRVRLGGVKRSLQSDVEALSNRLPVDLDVQGITTVSDTANAIKALPKGHVFKLKGKYWRMEEKMKLKNGKLVTVPIRVPAGGRF